MTCCSVALDCHFDVANTLANCRRWNPASTELADRIAFRSKQSCNTLTSIVRSQSELSVFSSFSSIRANLALAAAVLALTVAANFFMSSTSCGGATSSERGAVSLSFLCSLCSIDSSASTRRSMISSSLRSTSRCSSLEAIHFCSASLKRRTCCSIFFSSIFVAAVNFLCCTTSSSRDCVVVDGVIDAGASAGALPWAALNCSSDSSKRSICMSILLSSSSHWSLVALNCSSELFN
mmetsp:Transcript_41837/g.106562  ORF Transcript_41837/g.106562 Transcript_41837/m.106562 type:complete len:236 (+) Transcript_41837:126-833(+)